MSRNRMGIDIGGSEERSLVGVDGKLVAMGIQMVDFPPEAPWPSSILSLFSLGCYQEKVLGRERGFGLPGPN